MAKMNLPNKLTMMRMALVPLSMCFILIPSPENALTRVIAAAIFLIEALTDLFDGKIARKRGLVTDFGKLMDPLADKFMVVGALIAITGAFPEVRVATAWVTAIVFFRELGVTSLRLVCATGSDGVVVPAGPAGKLKTVFQCAAILALLLEPILLGWTGLPAYLVSYVLMGVMVVLTIYSGYIYFKAYWPRIGGF